MLNVSFPHIFAKVRQEFLYNQQAHQGEYQDCAIFGAYSATNEALTFHIMLDNGAVFSRVPIHALCWQECEMRSLSTLQSWDCFSEKITTVAYDFLRYCRCKVLLPQQEEAWGEYAGLTFDWYGNPWSECPWQYKCLHLIKLDEGNFTLQPNNHILWINQAFTDKNAIALTGEIPEYKSDRAVYVCER